MRQASKIKGLPKHRVNQRCPKKLKAYVYRLVDPRNGETFYAGKGRGGRVFAHERGELKGKDLRS